MLLIFFKSIILEIHILNGTQNIYVTCIVERYYSTDVCPFIYHSQSSTAGTPASLLHAKKANMT